MGTFLQSHKQILVSFIILFVVVGGLFLIPHSAHAGVNFEQTTFGKMWEVGGPGGGITEKGGGWIEKIVGWILFPFAWIFRLVGGLFMVIGGTLMTAAIEYSINFPINKIVGIQVGWAVMRDFANLFFIFIILWIAIKTILQLGNHDTKKMLVNVIVVALLINFSGFITRVVIDFGNVLAVGFYNTIVESKSPVTNSDNCNGKPCTIDNRIVSILGITSLPAAAKDAGSTLQVTLTYFLTALVLFVLGAVFFKATFYFVARTVAFCLLIVFSPIAFIAYVFPSGRVQGFATAWWGKLWGYTLLAPAFMIMMYLVLLIMTRGGLGAGGDGYGATIINFMIVIGLLWVGTSMAFKLADSAGTGFANWGSKITSGVALGAMTATGGFAMRQSAGRIAQKRAQNEELLKASQQGGFRGGFARMRLAGYEKAAKGSWDVSQSKYGAQGAGAIGASVPAALQRGQGGFEKTGRIEHTVAGRGAITKTQEADYAKRAKELFPDDAIAQREYLKNNLGATKTGSNYDAAKNKEIKEIKGKAASDEFKKAQEKIIEDHLKDLKASGAWTDQKDTELRDAMEKNDTAKITRLQGELNAALSTATTAGGTIGKEIKDAMQKLGPRFVSEFSEATLGSNIVGAHLTSGDLQQIHSSDMAGKYGDKTLAQRVGRNVFGSGKNAKGEDYLASPEGRKNLFGYGVSRRQVAGTKIYAKNARLRKKLKREIADIQLDISTYPPGTTPKERESAREAIAKLQDRLERKQTEFEKREEDTRTMLS